MNSFQSNGRRMVAADRVVSSRIAPMLAVSGPAPNGLEWAYEFRWSGRRCLALVDRDVVELVDCSHNWITQAYPAALLRALNHDRGMALDGVLAELDERTSTFALRSSRADDPPGGNERGETPSFIAFDLLWLDGTSFLSEPYWVRRSVLASLGLHRDPYVAVPPHFRDISPAQVLAIARDCQFDGIVAKHLDSPYLPGQHSQDWITTRCHSAQSTERAAAGRSLSRIQG